MHGLHRPHFHVEKFGDARPQVAPARVVAVGDVERLVGGRRRGRRPHHGARQKRHVDQLIGAVVERRAAGKAQRHAGVLGDGRVDRQRGQHVHLATDRESPHPVRPQARPGPRFALLARHQPVLLVVIEIGRHVARVVFLGRGLVGRAELDAVPLGALHQLDVLQVGRDRFDYVDQVGQHRQVGRDFLGKARPRRVGGEENMGDAGEAG